MPHGWRGEGRRSRDCINLDCCAIDISQPNTRTCDLDGLARQGVCGRLLACCLSLAGTAGQGIARVIVLLNHLQSAAAAVWSHNAFCTHRLPVGYTVASGAVSTQQLCAAAAAQQQEKSQGPHLFWRVFMNNVALPEVIERVFQRVQRVGRHLFSKQNKKERENGHTTTACRCVACTHQATQLMPADHQQAASSKTAPSQPCKTPCTQQGCTTPYLAVWPGSVGCNL